MTESEILLSDILTKKGIEFKPIPRSIVNGQKTPDYRVYLDGLESIWEVKELSENPKENDILKDLKNENSRLYSVNSSRARKKIKKACDQFKSFGATDKACVVALYDSRCFEVIDFHFTQYIIEAMFGKAEFQQCRDGNMREIKRENKLLTKTSKNYISAIVVLNGIPNETVFLHNPYAKIPILNLKTPFTKHFKFTFTEKGLEYIMI